MPSTVGSSGDVTRASRCVMRSRPVTAWFQVLGLLAGLACVPVPASAQPVALQAPEAGQIRALLIGIDAYRHVPLTRVF